jgi:hypothetical protein
MSKFTSRKFLAAIAGVLTGIALIVSGNTIEGASTVITSIVAYIVAEGYVDGKAVKNTIETTQDVLNEVAKDFEDFEETEVNKDASDT